MLSDPGLLATAHSGDLLSPLSYNRQAQLPKDPLHLGSLLKLMAALFPEKPGQPPPIPRDPPNSKSSQAPRANSGSTPLGVP